MVPIVDEAQKNGSKSLDASEAWQAIYAAPAFDFDPVTGPELHSLFHGEGEADLCEQMLASAARARGALDVELAERLNALR